MECLTSWIIGGVSSLTALVIVACLGETYEYFNRKPTRCHGEIFTSSQLRRAILDAADVWMRDSRISYRSTREVDVYVRLRRITWLWIGLIHRRIASDLSHELRRRGDAFTKYNIYVR